MKRIATMIIRRFPLDERGSVLVSALVIALILLIAGTKLLQITLNRAVTVKKTAVSEEARFAAQSVESIVQGCLFGKPSCSLSGCPVPQTVGGKPVSVAVSGAPPQCVLSITVGS